MPWCGVTPVHLRFFLSFFRPAFFSRFFVFFPAFPFFDAPLGAFFFLLAFFLLSLSLSSLLLSSLLLWSSSSLLLPDVSSSLLLSTLLLPSSLLSAACLLLVFLFFFFFFFGRFDERRLPPLPPRERWSFVSVSSNSSFVILRFFSALFSSLAACTAPTALSRSLVAVSRSRSNALTDFLSSASTAANFSFACFRLFGVLVAVLNFVCTFVMSSLCFAIFLLAVSSSTFALLTIFSSSASLFSDGPAGLAPSELGRPRPPALDEDTRLGTDARLDAALAALPRRARSAVLLVLGSGAISKRAAGSWKYAAFSPGQRSVTPAAAGICDQTNELSKPTNAARRGAARARARGVGVDEIIIGRTSTEDASQSTPNVLCASASLRGTNLSPGWYGRGLSSFEIIASL